MRAEALRRELRSYRRPYIESRRGKNTPGGNVGQNRSAVNAQASTGRLELLRRDDDAEEWRKRRSAENGKRRAAHDGGKTSETKS